jgi:pSer/pThr/pTyr-binding forkhead associated (FHA) protein
VWFDDGLRTGELWVPKLEQQVQSCDYFVVVLTPEAWASEWVQREFQLALITHRRILPLMLKETTISGFLLTLQWISVEDCTPEAAGQKLLQIVGPLEPESEPIPGPPHAKHPESVPPPPSALPDTITPEAAAAHIQPKLLVWSITSGVASRIVTLPHHQLTIGRDPDNDLVLSDAAVSRHHALLTEEQVSGKPLQWTLRAQPGSGPVYVNGQVTTQVVLRPFDQIVLGATLLRFEMSGAEQRLSLSATSMQCPLLIVDCPLCHFVAPLRDTYILLGRAPDCGLVIPSPVVARKQAELQRLPEGGYSITDCGGSNPVLWQGEPVKKRTLQHGDTLTIDAQIPSLTVMLRYSISPL